MNAKNNFTAEDAEDAEKNNSIASLCNEELFALKISLLWFRAIVFKREQISESREKSFYRL